MAIRVGNSSVTLDDVLSKVSESDIVAYYFNVTQIPCVIKSPLREDKKASFGFYTSDGIRIHWIDYATHESGGVFDLLMRAWHCDYQRCLELINDTMIRNQDVSMRVTKCTVHTTNEDNHTTQLECRTRDWKEHDIEYWKSYGITLKWLKWAEVYPISHKIVIKNGKRYIFGAHKYAYAFVEHKEGTTTLKIYQPYSKEYKWLNNHNSSVIGLWQKIPERGDRVIICSSLKDALCISCQLNIPAVYIQGEGYDVSETATRVLKEMYKKVYVSLDVDEAGIRGTKYLAEKHRFIPIIPDLGKQKDFSDYYLHLQDKQEFLKLKDYFK